MLLKDIPKIELHVHLDGSVIPDTVNELTNYKYSDLNEILIANNCNNLGDYLKKFELPLSVLQTKDNLTRVSYELCEEMLKENVIYAEIRFAPILHTNNLTLEEVLLSVLKGIIKSNLKVNLILCMMRGFDFKDNLATVDLASKYLNKGVCALDLAGDEAKYPNNLYKDLFVRAKDLNIPFTIHSGEASDYKSIDEALSLGASRIGHGINCNMEQIEYFKKNNIVLEMCPTSNIQTKAIKNIKEHPIYNLYKQGVLTTINTDNRTVSNTSLTKEYELLLFNFSFSIDDIIKMNENAIKGSFLNDSDKEELLNIYKKKIKNQDF